MSFDFPAETAPIIAILRGVRPNEILPIAAALEKSGIRAIEVPLNSPDPLESIGKLQTAFGDRCLCGAGTVLDSSEVDAVHRTGARLIVTPNTHEPVIRRAVELGLMVVPGCATATEAFQALRAGAHALKLFPAGTYGAGHLRALRDVLPRDIPLFAVGGVGAKNLQEWFAAGAYGVAVGGELYKPGDTPERVGERARLLIERYRSATNT